MFRAIDVMGFAGGFTTGMVQAGFELVGKRELYGGFGVANCEANRHILGNEWKAETLSRNSDSIDPWSVVDADVVFGNPPCSGFSVMSNRDFRGADSPINDCMRKLVKYAARVQPLIVVFESVQMARTRSDGLELMRQLRHGLEEMTGERWTLHHVRHNARFVGGVAERRRYFWVASRIPFGVDPDTLTQGDTVLNDAIADLAGMSLQWAPQIYRNEPTGWSTDKRSTSGLVDGHITQDTPLARRCMDLAAGVDWNPDEHLAIVARRYWDTYAKLPDSWSHTEEKVVKSDFRLGYTTPTRWNGDRPSRVITGGSMCCALHPSADRMITHREAARIMGFPDDWLIEPLRNVPGLSMTWGKGITVQCGRWIGRAITRALSGEPDAYKGEPIGDREYDIDYTNGPKTMRARGSVTRVEVRLHSGGTIMSETATRRQGRPRPNETLDRDQRVLEWLQKQDSGKTREEIATGTELGANLVYLSLYRLRRDGKAVRAHESGAHRWSVVKTEAPSE